MVGGQLAGFHEASHVIVAADVLDLRVREVWIDPPRGLTRFWRDRSLLRLTPRRQCLLHLAGDAAEAKLLGRPVPDVSTKVRTAMRRLWRRETLPTTDAVNIARTLVAETCDDLLAQSLLTRRTAYVWRLLDHDAIWAKIEMVATALIAEGRLTGSEVEDLIADQQLQRDTIFRFVA